MSGQERSILISRISQSLSLDEPTVASQLFPHLNSLSSPSLANTYLIELLGDNKGEHGKLIDDYIRFRFPGAIKKVINPIIQPQPSLASRLGGGGSSSNVGGSNKVSLNTSARGQVKPKEKAKEINWLGGSNTKATTGGAKTQQALLVLAEEKAIRVEQERVDGIENRAIKSYKKEQSDLDQQILAFTSEEQEKDGICFCGGLDHSLNVYVKNCEKCGLSLCDRIQIRANLKCPSCATPLILEFLVTKSITSLNNQKQFLLVQETNRQESLQLKFLEQQQLLYQQQQLKELELRGRNYSNIAGSINNFTTEDPLPSELMTKKISSSNTAPSAVLRVVGKKVTRVTKLPKKVIEKPVVVKEKKEVLVESESESEESEDENGCFIDYLDDGVAPKKVAKQKKVERSTFYNPNFILNYVELKPTSVA